MDGAVSGPRPRYAAWTRRTNAITRHMVGVQPPGSINLAGGLPAPEIYPVAAVSAATERALRRFGPRALAYGPVAGLPELRALLARRFSRPGRVLGPDNVLVMAPGTLSGTSAPTSGRLSLGCKSPLTNGIKEANVGGNPGQDLMKLGYRAVVVTGQPADRSRRWGLKVNEQGVELVAADEYKGMWNYPLCEKLLADAPKSASVISIGPAGEMMMKGASIACTDDDRARRPARQAARGGVGAVMGSKCLKWVLVDPAKIPVRRPADRKGFSTYTKEFSKDYRASRHGNFK